MKNDLIILHLLDSIWVMQVCVLHSRYVRLISAHIYKHALMYFNLHLRNTKYFFTQNECKNECIPSIFHLFILSILQLFSHSLIRPLQMLIEEHGCC